MKKREYRALRAVTQEDDTEDAGEQVIEALILKMLEYTHTAGPATTTGLEALQELSG